MASARRIQLSPMTDCGVFSASIQEDSARTASELLQHDMENHNVFFNDMGFHNHLVHMILSLYALGASPDDLTAGYKRVASFQRPVHPTDHSIVDALRDKTKFQEHVGKGVDYPNFLAFFQREIDAKGVGAVLDEYMFAGDDRAEGMLCRVFGGVIHPFIHLGFGLEFNQPAIVAQALAQTAVHKDELGRNFFLPAEKLAGGIGLSGKKSLQQLLDEIREDEAFARGGTWSDALIQGVLERAPREMLHYASQYHVPVEQLQEREADMINTVVYYTMASQRKEKAIMMDFFFIHSVNSAIFFSKILKLPFLSQQMKARLLEWKGRFDLLLYVSGGSPDLRLDDITSHPATMDWSTIFSRAVTHPTDDGHMVKLVRAVAHGEKVCRALEGSQKMVITGDMWRQIGNMVIDSTAKADGVRTMWVRSAGFDEAWASVPGRANL